MEELSGCTFEDASYEALLCEIKTLLSDFDLRQAREKVEAFLKKLEDSGNES